MQRFTAWALAILLLVLAAPVSAEGTYVMAGFDGDNLYHDWNTNLFFQRMQEKTGVTFTFQQYDDYDNWQAAKTEMFATGELPDVLFKAELTPQETMEYYESGQLIDLAPLLDEYMPNLSALLAANPEWAKDITLSNGAIPALPGINTMQSDNAIWINKNWLTNLNLSVPTDADSFKAVLEAFRDKDPNLNGKQDEIPMTFLGIWDLKFMAHAFGLIANDYNVYVNDEGTVEYMIAQEEFKTFITWVRDMYQSGLLDKSGFTTADTFRQITDEDAVLTYGVLMGPSALELLPVSMASQYVIVEPLMYQGEQIYRDFTGDINRGGLAITSACENPGELLSWVDYLYSEEGAILAYFGLEGAEYQFTEDGTWDWIADAQTVSSQVVRESLIGDSGTFPGLSAGEFQLSYTDQTAVAIIKSLIHFDSFTVLPYPLVFLPKEDQLAIDQLQASLGKTVDETLSRFILGEIELNDETWQAFQEELVAQDLAEFLNIWQTALDAR